MRSGLLVAALWAAGVPAQASSAPTRAAQRRAYEAAQGSQVEVLGKRGRGPGIVVGAHGEVATSVDYVGLETAQVKVDQATVHAQVTAADARLRVALLQLPEEQRSSRRAAAVLVGREVVEGEHLIGVARFDGQAAQPRAGRVTRIEPPFLELDLTLEPGSPVYDAQARLVAIATHRRARGCLALPVSALKELARRSPP